MNTKDHDRSEVLVFGCIRSSDERHGMPTVHDVRRFEMNRTHHFSSGSFSFDGFSHEHEHEHKNDKNNTRTICILQSIEQRVAKTHPSN